MVATKLNLGCRVELTLQSIGTPSSDFLPDLTSPRSVRDGDDMSVEPSEPSEDDIILTPELYRVGRRDYHKLVGHVVSRSVEIGGAPSENGRSYWWTNQRPLRTPEHGLGHDRKWGKKMWPYGFSAQEGRN
ncbi:hypothetical protein SPHV1_2270198 [Novosphingobium sp. KN65.2]|nr:hypothetical protein SPHV1_2270198 [Novosphingobium sp. KN65.2]